MQKGTRMPPLMRKYPTSYLRRSIRTPRSAFSAIYVMWIKVMYDIWIPIVNKPFIKSNLHLQSNFALVDIGP